MFITLQLPLVDYRCLQNVSAKLDFPNWPEPDPQAEKILYFGKIFNNDANYTGPWDGEKRYCNAKSVINFCGLGEEQFYKSLGEPFDSKIIFRRFQSDGKFLVKFEIGFYDDFELNLDKDGKSPEEMKQALYNHINNYLLCPVKIKKGSRKYKEKTNRYSSFISLVHSANELANSYYWASYKKGDKRNFDEKVRRNYIIPCDPVVIVHLDTAIIPLKDLSIKAVDISELGNKDMSLYFDYIPHRFEKNYYHTKSWFIGINDLSDVLPSQFAYNDYDQSILNLRINLLRIHSEVVILKKVLQRIGKNLPGELSTPETKRRAINYLHKIFYNLSKFKRNSQPQQNLVQESIRLEELINENDVIEDQMKGLNEVISEIEKYEVTDTNQKVINYSYQYNTIMGDQISIGNMTGNFINKSHLVNSLNAAAANGMSEEFRQDLISIAKKIEDSKDEIAADVLNKMTEELAKPQPQQDKSKIKKFWDGLVKLVPDVAAIGKAVATVVALF